MKPTFIALHEMRLYLRDRADLVFSLILPIAIFALMYGAFSDQATFHGTAHIVNEDGQEYSQNLIDLLKRSENLDIEILSAAEANDQLERSSLLMAIYIPSDFSKNLEAGEKTELIFRQRGNGGNEGQIVGSLVRGAAEEMNRKLQTVKRIERTLVGNDIAPSRIEAAANWANKREQDHPLVAVEEDSLGGSPDPVNQFLPGIITMFVLFAITLNARALVEERKRGTLERLLTTKMRLSQLFVGKFLAGTFRGFLQALILLTLSYAVFKLFTPLSFLEVLVIALVFSAAAGAVGLLIGSIARTEDQTSWMAVVFTMATSMLGGTFFEPPQDSVLESLSVGSMNTYVNDALKTIIVSGGTISDVGPDLAVLVGVAVGALVLARLFFKAVPGGA